MWVKQVGQSWELEARKVGGEGREEGIARKVG
jgi:hypothetical protein